MTAERQVREKSDFPTPTSLLIRVIRVHPRNPRPKRVCSRHLTKIVRPKSGHSRLAGRSGGRTLAAEGNGSLPFSSNVIGAIWSKLMKWETPQASDMRYGFEITMYIANR